jgi:hypothetical protein
MTLFLFAWTGCSDDGGDSGEGTPYDPDKPVLLTEFLPETGGMASQVIIKGSNFGTDPSALKVYFNNKEAKVVKTIGDLAYVLTPRLPGDTCTISVAIG